MQITQLILGDYATNCYIMEDEGSNVCAIIDPADNGMQIIKEIEESGSEPAAIFLTHGHYDHILAVPVILERWPKIPVYCHKADCPDALTEVDMGVTYPTVSAFSNLCYYKENQVLFIGSIPVKVWHTPGHSKGSVTLEAGNVLFTGDTLFNGDIGRSDFAGGSYKELIKSLKMLASLPGDYQVLPGHDGVSTLNNERKNNPYLR